MSVAVELVTAPASIADFRRLWDGLVEASDCRSPFVMREWLDPWARVLGSARLACFIVRNHRQIIAFAALTRAGRRPFGQSPAFELAGESDLASDGCDIIIRPSLEEIAARALAQEWHRRRCSLVFSALSDAHAIQRVCDALRELNWTVFQRPFGESPLVRIANRSWPSYLRSLSSHHRRDFMRRWRGRGGSAAFGRPALRSFHDLATANLLATRRLRLHALCVENTTAAIVYCISHKGRVSLYQHAFDARFARLGVGQVAVGLAKLIPPGLAGIPRRAAQHLRSAGARMRRAARRAGFGR